MELTRSLTNAARHGVFTPPPPEDGSTAQNGGFPEPPAGVPVHVVRASHEACGAETRIRLPAPVPARAVRRVVCDHCERPFACEAVEDLASGGGTASANGHGTLAGVPALEPAPTSPGRRGWLSNPPGPAWRILSVPLAAAGVIVGLILLQGSDESSPQRPAQAGRATSGDASLVRQPGWSVALPSGWERTPGEQGAAFAATSQDGTADATLWIEQDPSLSFAQFEDRSLGQLRQLAGSAEVVERSAGPTPERTVVRLESNAESAGGWAPYTVTLRASGPYRYYLSTSLQPGVSARDVAAADLIHSSFVPEPGEPPNVTGIP